MLRRCHPCRSGRRLAAAALTAGIIAASPALAAKAVPYKGTEKKDTIDFRNANKSYDIKALGGDDLVYAGRSADKIDGGKGRDTIDPWYGDDVVYGGPDGDYFRYGTSFDGIWGYSGDDTICDFGSGDKLDVYISFLDGEGSPKNVGGGNFASFDTNKDGVIDKNDRTATIKKNKTCGKSKDSLVLDVDAALYDPDHDSSSPGPTFITLYGVTSLKKSQFVKDYFRDHPY